MKATGIIRCTDDLGRVVIPKEIRKHLKIRGGTPLELYLGEDGEVIFKKAFTSTDWDTVSRVMRGLDSGLLLITEQDDTKWINPGLFSDELEDLLKKVDELSTDESMCFKTDSRQVMIKKIEIEGYVYAIVTATMTSMHSLETVLRKFLEY